MGKKSRKELLMLRRVDDGRGVIEWRTSNPAVPRSSHLNKNPMHPDMHPISEGPSDFTLGRFNCRGEYVIPKGR